MKRIIYISLLIIAGLGGFIIGYNIKGEQKALIKEVKVYETKYKYIPATCEEAKKCVQSAIQITVEDNTTKKELKENEIFIKAGDDCKEATAVVTVNNTNKQKILSYLTGGFIAGALTILAIIVVF